MFPHSRSIRRLQRITGRMALVLALGLVGASFQDLATRLSSPTRSEADRALDPVRRPAAVLDFLGIEPGMQVADLLASGGWYTEVLSIAVGSEGRVYAQNSPAVLEIRDGEYAKQLAARLADGRLANVVRVDVNLSESDIADGSLDAAITALNLHDIYFVRGQETTLAFLESVHAKLAPGGVFGIIDHAGRSGQPNAELHRIEKLIVLDLIQQSSFSLEAESALLANPDDDYAKSVFDPTIRGKSDRFLLRLRKAKP